MGLSCLVRRVSSAAIVAMFGEYMLLRCVKQTLELLLSISEWSRAGHGRSFSACCIDEVGVQDIVVTLIHISFVFCILFGSLYSLMYYQE
jgi:hypothetical protein